MEQDALFREAVAALDAGDLPGLERILARRPELARVRLEEPGPWLRDQVGAALDGFFARPYLLWFVAEDPVRKGKLPANAPAMAAAIVEAARGDGAVALQEQLDHALRLVAWSCVARDSGVQIELIDLLADAGASLAGTPDDALVNGNLAAAAHLVERGAPLSLSVALCLGRWDDAARLAGAATPAQKQLALVQAALNGRPEAVRRAIELGAEPNTPSAELFSHGTPLHHAVCSGSLETVVALVEAGAELGTTDTLWQGAPLDWALHYESERGAPYAEIAAYLRVMHPEVR